MKRVISVWLPHFATDRLRRKSSRKKDRQDSGGPARPFVLLREESGRLLLAALDARAAAAGLTPGQSLADARAILPGLETADHDPAADARALAELAAWCGRFTPWVAPDRSACDGGGSAGLLLDITGCAHLFGGEAALLRKLLSGLRDLGLTARAALADTPGAAWAVARFGGRSLAVSGPDAGAHIVPPGAAREALAKLPAAALRLPAEQVELLARLGLRRVGDLTAIPAAALAPRCGPLVTRRLEQAFGRREEAISPLIPVPPLLERFVLAEPSQAAEAIAAGLEALILALCRRLEKAGQGARRLVFTLHRADGSRGRLSIGTSRPVREPQHLQRLFAQQLAQADPGFGVEVMTLAATASEPLSALQCALPGEADRAAAKPEALGEVVDRLVNRLGVDRVSRPAARESHIPERAAASAPAFEAAALPWRRPPQPRPLRLFERAQPIEAMALLPDHPPRQFRWRRLLHRVAAAEGPERLSPEWWHREPAAAEAPARDYFRVEDDDGRRYWVYRAEGRWYLHGLFA